MLRKPIIIILVCFLILLISGCDKKNNETEYKYQKYAEMETEEIVSSLSLEQKAYQMVQPACYNMLFRAIPVPFRVFPLIHKKPSVRTSWLRAYVQAEYPFFVFGYTTSVIP